MESTTTHSVVEGNQIDQSISEYRWNRQEWEYLWNLYSIDE